MGNPDPHDHELEIEGLQWALYEESLRCLEVQKQLDRINAEFEEFVSMAAHNLREPLRDVSAFSQLLAETQAGRLDADGGVFLDRIQSGAQRMQSLLAVLVDYWATSPGGLQSSRTDMEAVLCQALLCTQPQVTQRGAIVTHDRLPAVMGDFQLLAKVLHHLIRNAIQYADGATPRIHVFSRGVDPDWVVSVQDNGPGIEPAFHERIFAPFRRLHGPEIPGHGLGLALCKKLIGWHGGRIWVESTPGAGATFHFTLPPAD